MIAGDQTRVVLITCANAREAAAIARTLVKERLAACANIVGRVRSIYRWRGKIEDQREHLMIVKTRAALLPALERRVRAMHSYDVPEMLALAPHAGSADYLAWLREATLPPARAIRRRR